MKTEDPEALLSELVRRLPFCARNIEEEYPLWAAALDNLSHRSSDALYTLRQRVEAAEKMAEHSGRQTELVDEMCEAVDCEYADIGGQRGSLEILQDLGRHLSEMKPALAAFRATGGEG